MGVRSTAEENAENSEKVVYSVKYTLKSGRTVYREYQLNRVDCLDMVRKLYQSEEYKEGHFPIYQWDENDVTKISCNNSFETKEFSLDRSERRRLLNLYKEELKSLTIEQKMSEVPVASLILEISDDWIQYYSIYSSFVNTINFLNEHGFDATRVISTQDIDRIVIYNNIDYYAMMEARDHEIATRDVDYDDEGTVYQDPQQIKEIFSNIIPTDYESNNRIILETENNIDIIVVIKTDEFGNENNLSYRFRKDQIPEFILDNTGE